MLLAFVITFGVPNTSDFHRVRGLTVHDTCSTVMILPYLLTFAAGLLMSGSTVLFLNSDIMILNEEMNLE